MGDAAVEVRQSTWTASLPGERYSSAWITDLYVAPALMDVDLQILWKSWPAIIHGSGAY